MLLLPSLLIGLGLLSPVSPAPKLQAENLFPVTPGSTWTMRLTVPGRTDPVELKIEAIKPDPAADDRGVLRYTIDGQERQQETYSVTDKEVARIRSGLGGANVIEPPIPVIEYPMAEGKTWNWKGTITLPGEGKSNTFSGEAKLIVAGPEEVKTDAGTFKAYRVDLSLTLSAGDATQSVFNSYWFAPGVGMVKQAYTAGAQKSEGVLTSYSIK